MALHSSFQGLSLQYPRSQRNVRKSIFVVKGTQASFGFVIPWQSQRRHNFNNKVDIFLTAGYNTFTFLLRTRYPRYQLRTFCTKKPFHGTRMLTDYISPIWKEGLFLFRCSIFLAVISAIGVLVWYGKLRARNYIESQLLPSACSILGEYLQREIKIGSVKNISPLGLTLSSCSIGPHHEEFSCGEVPSVKLRIRPFVSLMRGKVVVDAVLSKPNVLIAQKEDFSWLGIPSTSEIGFIKRHSSEEGIDHRTKIIREAREKSAYDWSKERVKLAKEAAEMGYIVHRFDSEYVINDSFKDGSQYSGSFCCVDEKIHMRDCHWIDTTRGYCSKHADMEKSFGQKIYNEGLNFQSGIIPNFITRKFRQGAHKKVLESAFNARQRNLVRSATAASAYFCMLDGNRESYRTKADDISMVSKIQYTSVEETPVVLDSVYFTDGDLMLLGFGDREARYDKFVKVLQLAYYTVIQLLDSSVSQLILASGI